MIQVNGSFPDRFQKTSTGLQLVLSADTTINIFEGLSIKYSELANNDLGLMTLQNVGNQSKVRWGSLTNMQHVLSPRKGGCTGGSKGSIHMNVDEADMNAVEYKGRICPDIFWDNCLEQILGTGTDIRNLMATDKGATLFQMILKKVMNAIGNGIHELAWFGSHPSIASSLAGNWFMHGQDELNEGDLQDWINFVDQQQASTGFATLLENLKNTGNDRNFKCPIELGTELHSTTKVWIGNPDTFFKKLLTYQTKRMELLTDQLPSGELPNIIVSKDIFESYKNYLQVTFPGLQAAYEYKVRGVDGSVTSARNVLLWNGYKVIYNNEYKKFDSIVGTDTTFAVLAYPNVFGFAFDTPLVAQAQYSGAGLIVEFSNNIHEDGLIRLRTDFKVNSTILDKNLIAYGSYIRTPTA